MVKKETRLVVCIYVNEKISVNEMYIENVYIINEKISIRKIFDQTEDAV